MVKNPGALSPNSYKLQNFKKKMQNERKLKNLTALSQDFPAENFSSIMESQKQDYIDEEARKPMISINLQGNGLTTQSPYTQVA